MIVNKAIDLNVLQQELVAAGVAVTALGLSAGNNLYTYDANGGIIDVPAGAAAVVTAHAGPKVYTSAQQLPPQRRRTTNATPVEIFRYTIPPATEYTAVLTMRAITDDIANLREIERKFRVARGTGNGLVFVPATVGGQTIQTLFDGTIGAGGSVAVPPITLSGNDIVITVTGIAATNINWLLTGSYETFAPLGGA